MVKKKAKRHKIVSAEEPDVVEREGLGEKTASKTKASGVSMSRPSIRAVKCEPRKSRVTGINLRQIRRNQLSPKSVCCLLKAIRIPVMTRKTPKI